MGESLRGWLVCHCWRMRPQTKCESLVTLAMDDDLWHHALVGFFFVATYLKSGKVFLRRVCLGSLWKLERRALVQQRVLQGVDIGASLLEANEMTCNITNRRRRRAYIC